MQKLSTVSILKLEEHDMMHILVDIDHVLSDAYWRDAMIGGPGGWDEYHNNAPRDEPFIHVIDLVNALSTRYTMIGVTARPEKWRQITMKYLADHGAMLEELLMRPDDAYHPAPQLKLDLAVKRFGQPLHNQVAFIMDDREDVAIAFNNAGVPALQVYARRHKS